MIKEDLVKCSKEFIKARSQMARLLDEIKIIQKLVYKYEFTAKQQISKMNTQVSKMNTQVKKIRKKLESIEVNYEILRTKGELLKDKMDSFIN
jgi:phage shock protein A